MTKLDGGLKVLAVGIVLAVTSACATAPKEEAPPEPAAPEATQEVAPTPTPTPTPKAMPTSEPMVEDEGGVSRYTVVRGDNLWDISSFRVIYGNPYQWPLIYKANSDQIDDADLIFPDQELVIPRDSSASDVDAAVQHAKTRGAWTLGVAEESDLAYMAQ